METRKQEPPLQVVSNLTYEPQYVVSPAVGPSPISFMSTSSNMGETSLASTVMMAGDEYSFYRSWLRDQVDKDPELAAQWVQWEAQGLISPKAANKPHTPPWGESAPSTSSSAALLHAAHAHPSAGHHSSSHKKAEPDLREQIARHLAAAHGSGGDGTHTSAAAAAVAAADAAPGSPAARERHALRTGGLVTSLAGAAGLASSLFRSSTRSSSSGSTRSPKSRDSTDSKSPTRKAELSRTQLKAVRKLFPIMAPATKPAAALQGEYQLLDIIGKGAFGCAYKARHLPTGRLMCIKTLETPTGPNQEENLVRQKREVAVLSALALHPNIIRYHECFADSGKLQLVMEWADGGDLDSVIQRNAKARTYMTEEQILGYFVQLISALGHTHGVGIMHRDIKTNNIFLTSKGLVKLGDYGIAKVLDAAATSSNSGSGSKAAGSAGTSSSGISTYPTRGVWAHSFVGTPNYLAPEMVNCEGYGFKADIWAAGCVLYEMAALKPAFRGKSLSIIYHLIRRGKTSPLPSIYSKQLRELQRRMMAQDPAERPSCAELLQDDFLRPHLARYHTLLRQLRLELPRLPCDLPDGSTSGACMTAALLTRRQSSGGSSTSPSCRTSVEDMGWSRQGARKKGSRESAEFKLPAASPGSQAGAAQSQAEQLKTAAAACALGSTLYQSTGSNVKSSAVAAAAAGVSSRASLEAMPQHIHAAPLPAQPTALGRWKARHSSEDEASCGRVAVAALPAAQQAAAAAGPLVGRGPGPHSKLLSRDVSKQSMSSAGTDGSGLNSFGSGVAGDISNSDGESPECSSPCNIESSTPGLPARMGGGAGWTLKAGAPAEAAVSGPGGSGGSGGVADLRVLMKPIKRVSSLEAGRPAALRIDVLGESPHTSASSAVHAYCNSCSTAATGASTTRSDRSSLEVPAGAAYRDGDAVLGPDSVLLQQLQRVQQQQLEQEQQQLQQEKKQQQGGKGSKVGRRRRKKRLLQQLHSSWAALFCSSSSSSAKNKPRSRLGDSSLQSSAFPSKKLLHGAIPRTGSTGSSSDGVIRAGEAPLLSGEDAGQYTDRSWSDLLREAGISSTNPADAALLQQAGQVWETSRQNSPGASQRSSLDKPPPGSSTSLYRRSLQKHMQQAEAPLASAAGSVGSMQDISARGSAASSAKNSPSGKGGQGRPAAFSGSDSSPTGSQNSKASPTGASPITAAGKQGSVELPVPANGKPACVLTAWFGRPSRGSRDSRHSTESSGSRGSKSQHAGEVAVAGGGAAGAAQRVDATTQQQQQPQLAPPQQQEPQQQQATAGSSAPESPAELHAALPVCPSAAAVTSSTQLSQQLRQLTAAFGQGVFGSSLSTITEGSESRLVSRRASELTGTSSSAHSVRSSLDVTSPKIAGSAGRTLSHLGPSAGRSGAAAALLDGAQHLSPVLESSGSDAADAVSPAAGAADRAEPADQLDRDDLMEREQLLAVVALQKLKEVLSHPLPAGTPPWVVAAQ